MGINLVVFVENRRNITLATLKEELLKHDVLGYLAWGHWERDGDVSEWTPWEDFEWEGKRYFTWIGSPRISSFDPYEFNSDEPEPQDTEITFLKIMALLEEIAGGPIYIGTDVVLNSSPPEPSEEDQDFPFWIPSELDDLCPKWREIAGLDVSPTLIF